MNDIILEMKNVTKTFPEKPDRNVLDSIDISITMGSITGLVGKNGAGKSTMIKILLGIIRPDSGAGRVFGENSWNLSPAVKERIGYVPQVMTGFRWMRIETFLDYTGAFYRSWNEKKLEMLLKEWDLDPWSKIGSLSEGERQKLSIIQAMGHDPDVYVFDEPVASLDPIARRKFIRQLIDLNAGENKTMLFSTHITSDLERVAAEIALLSNGKITFKGELSELKDRVRKLRISAEKDLPDPLPIANILNSKIYDNSAIVTVNGLSDEDIAGLKQKLSAEIAVEQLNLEDIFLELNQ